MRAFSLLLLGLCVVAVSAGGGCYNANGNHQCECILESECTGTWTDGCSCITPYGCYDTSAHVCTCGDTTDETTCTDAGSLWTDSCECDAEEGLSLGSGCGWNPGGGYYNTPLGGSSCTEFNHVLDGTTGDTLGPLQISYDDVVMMAMDDTTSGCYDTTTHACSYGGTEADCTGSWTDSCLEFNYDQCVMDGHSTLAPYAEKAHTFTMTFNKPGSYHLTSSADGECAAGLKLDITITGDDLGENKIDVEPHYADNHEEHANPGDGDDWEAFGKDVYHDKAYDNLLHSVCESDTICVDYEVSLGSCYFAGEDFDVGHAVFCDVSEVECCGYMGCAADDNRGKYTDGTSHSYYHYVTGYVSGSSGCCHCFAGCDHDLETRDLDADGQCTYLDVTLPVGSESAPDGCNRGPMDSTEMDTIGYLKCGTDGFTLEEAMFRELPGDYGSDEEGDGDS